MKRERKETSDQTEPFAVIIQNKPDFPRASQVQVRITSPFLTEIIDVLKPRIIDQSAKCKKKALLDGPELFRIREGLRNEQTSAAEKVASEASSSDDSSSNREKLLHLKHLVRFMDKEFEKIQQMYAAMQSGKRCVSWEMLWAFFPPGERVAYLDKVTEETLCGDVLEAYYKKNREGNLYFVIKVTKWDYNCRTWKRYSRKVKVSSFKKELEICSLDIHPLRFMENPEAAVKEFLEHGSRFCELSMKERSCFRNYKGPMIRCLQAYRQVSSNVQGERRRGVMIDLGSFAKMNPDYPPLESAKPPSDVIRTNNVTTHDITKIEDRMFAPGMGYGFSFRLKQWGSFCVSGFSDIIFNTSAFDDLLMDENT